MPMASGYSPDSREVLRGRLERDGEAARPMQHRWDGTRTIKAAVARFHGSVEVHLEFFLSVRALLVGNPWGHRRPKSLGQWPSPGLKPATWGPGSPMDRGDTMVGRDGVQELNDAGRAWSAGKPNREGRRVANLR